MNNDFKILDEKLVYHNPWLKVFEYSISRYSKKGIYGVVERDDSIVMIPVSTSCKTILLEQYRFPTKSNSWELPMGGIDKNEDPITAAKRELYEETTLIVEKNIKHIGTYNAVPGLTPQKVNIFLVKVSDEELNKAFTPSETDEIVSFKILDLKDVFTMVKNGNITDGFTLSSLLFLRLELEKEQICL